jgi:hypothetical protein
MAKNFPYFKFDAATWLLGNISFEPLEIQGLFISICAIYWQRDCVLHLEDLEKRYKSEMLAKLTQRFISVNQDGSISISFLDEQFEDVGHISLKNSINGSKGGRPRTAQLIDSHKEKPTALPSVSQIKPNENPKESKERRGEEKRGEEEEDRSSPPTLSINSINSKDCQAFVDKLKRDQLYVEVLAKNNSKEISDIRVLLDKFVFDNSGMHKIWANETDLRQHFRSWLPMHLSKNKPTTLEPKKRVYE